jgi:hypothetical protein
MELGLNQPELPGLVSRLGEVEAVVVAEPHQVLIQLPNRVAQVVVAVDTQRFFCLRLTWELQRL